MVTFKRADDAPTPGGSGRRGITRIENADAVRGLVEYGSLEIGARSYRVPPIDYLTGFKLQALMMRMAELYRAEATPASHREYQATIKETIAVARRLLIPTTRRTAERWLWLLFRWRPFNPLRRASEADLLALLDFFWRCRMQSRGRIRLPMTMTARTE